MAPARLLIVDDEVDMLEGLKRLLSYELRDVEILTFSQGRQALRLVRREPVDLVLLDIRMPEMDGLQLLEALRQEDPSLTVIMMTAYGSIEVAVEAMRQGAYDFITKPFDSEALVRTVTKGLERSRLLRENRALRQRLEKKYEIVGNSEAIQQVKAQILAAAPTNGRVLILGESGTGKELVARAIHRGSLRRDKPFVEVNCAAIPEDLIESELFGHEKGSFTGATSKRHGKFELADGGTIFLDEVGDMSLKTQAKVLRVLQEQTLERVGGTDTISVDVRVITASNKKLEEEIRKGTFREDLFYRLNVIPIYVPPLRERKEDISVLTRYFLTEFSIEHGKREKTISQDALELMMEYPWPGNVRELKNLIERMVIMVPGDMIQASDLYSSLYTRAPLPLEAALLNESLKEACHRFERDYILRRLEENHWNITRTAEKLKIERSNLYRKLRAYGIDTLVGSKR